uniref:Putative secreted protein n=1 Tax=Anopheles triannulatus TaxID=58253 RepID=A0A2M4B5Y1_9DIPT
MRSAFCWAAVIGSSRPAIARAFSLAAPSGVALKIPVPCDSVTEAAVGGAATTPTPAVPFATSPPCGVDDSAPRLWSLPLTLLQYPLLLPVLLSDGPALGCSRRFLYS